MSVSQISNEMPELFISISSGIKILKINLKRIKILRVEGFSKFRSKRKEQPKIISYI